MRLAWNLVILGARELHEDWTWILESGQPVPTQSDQGRFQAGETSTEKSTPSRQNGYVGKNSDSPPIRQSHGEYNKKLISDKQLLCTQCRYKRNVKKEGNKLRQTRFWMSNLWLCLFIMQTLF